MSLPNSLYAAVTPTIGSFPPFEGGATSVAIVGGGYTGLSTALHLRERGVEVTVLERHEPGWGASGRNGGQVNPGVKPDPAAIETLLGRERGGRLIDLTYRAPDRLFELIRRHGIDCNAQQTGSLRAACTPEMAGMLRAAADQCEERRLPGRLLDLDQVRDATGTSQYLNALHYLNGGSVNPLALARGLAARAETLGVRIHGNSPVLALGREGGRWRLTTPTGQLAADKILIATNGYTDNLWPGLRRSIVPVYSAIAATSPLPRDIAGRILPGRASLYEAGLVTVYYRIDEHDRLLIGGRGPMREIADASSLPFLTQYAQKLWPFIGDPHWAYGWTGQVAVTRDALPHVHEPADDLLVCLGYNGRGVALATTIGAQLAARLVEGPAAELDLPITPVRQILLHRFWKIGVGSTVLYSRLRNSFR